MVTVYDRLVRGIIIRETTVRHVAIWFVGMVVFIAGAVLYGGTQGITHDSAPRPFNVYETESACVYVVGAAQPAIAVMPKQRNGTRGC